MPAGRASSCSHPRLKTPKHSSGGSQAQQGSAPTRTCRVPGCKEPLDPGYSECGKIHTLDAFDEGRHSCRDSLDRHQRNRLARRHERGQASSHRRAKQDAPVKQQPASEQSGRREQQQQQQQQQEAQEEAQEQPAPLLAPAPIQQTPPPPPPQQQQQPAAAAARPKRSRASAPLPARSEALSASASAQGAAPTRSYTSPTAQRSPGQQKQPPRQQRRQAPGPEAAALEQQDSVALPGLPQLAQLLPMPAPPPPPLPLPLPLPLPDAEPRRLAGPGWQPLRQQHQHQHQLQQHQQQGTVVEVAVRVHSTPWQHQPSWQQQQQQQQPWQHVAQVPLPPLPAPPQATEEEQHLPVPADLPLLSVMVEGGSDPSPSPHLVRQALQLLEHPELDGSDPEGEVPSEDEMASISQELGIPLKTAGSTPRSVSAIPGPAAAAAHQPGLPPASQRERGEARQGEPATKRARVEGSAAAAWLARSASARSGWGAALAPLPQAGTPTSGLSPAAAALSSIPSGDSSALTAIMPRAGSSALHPQQLTLAPAASSGPSHPSAAWLAADARLPPPPPLPSAAAPPPPFDLPPSSAALAPALSSNPVGMHLFDTTGLTSSINILVRPSDLRGGHWQHHAHTHAYTHRHAPSATRPQPDGSDGAEPGPF
ncbi:hypothetical protein CHLNCDRAFT_136695 [Chlorella variabilis]|uniref:Uncharacterized protein n=1 Tax=Chlorella variabilis TaxID=554065 RepID=E1ZKV2_CHLVA|nr:hypothetical protein CHLNCDRAFT_136695 [Chlorella variabilis]EFN53445.1 hypothetical protein CHLNCDRAFT_136695 [Chlorella variabilis]|eukprot:XP_005845547.1 hypothetical protein CHLNCDRAFT_136695 [Chlorella variabilis]